jgi:hypothetical protein
MARTQINGTQVGDGTVGRADLNTATAGSAVIRKVIAGTGITISSTGVDEGTGDVTVNAPGHTVRVSHTWAIAGTVAVSASLSMFVSLAAGQTAKAVAARYKIGAGTSATISVRKNGVDMTGFTALSATTTAATSNPTDVTLAEGDELSLNITAISGAPTGLSFTLFLEHIV